MQQCRFVYTITRADCRACNGLDAGCRNYEPNPDEKAWRETDAEAKRQLPRLFPRGNSHAAGALRHGSQHDPLSHRCAMPDFPLSSLRASSPRSGWKSFLKGRAKSTAESLLMMPNTLATGFKPWLPPSGKLARERLRG